MQISFDVTSVIINLSTSGIIIFVTLLIIFNWQNISSFIADTLNALSMFAKSGQSGTIRRNIESDINKMVVDLDREVPGLFNNSVKVEWLEEGNDHATFKDGSIFVRVRETTDQDLIFVNSVMSLLERTLLVDARQYLHRNVLNGIKLVLASKFTSNSRFKFSQPVFRE